MEFPLRTPACKIHFYLKLGGVRAPPPQVLKVLKRSKFLQLKVYFTLIIIVHNSSLRKKKSSIFAQLESSDCERPGKVFIRQELVNVIHHESL